MIIYYYYSFLYLDFFLEVADVSYNKDEELVHFKFANALEVRSFSICCKNLFFLQKHLYGTLQFVWITFSVSKQKMSYIYLQITMSCYTHSLTLKMRHLFSGLFNVCLSFKTYLTEVFSIHGKYLLTNSIDEIIDFAGYSEKVMQLTLLI